MNEILYLMRCLYVFVIIALIVTGCNGNNDPPCESFSAPDPCPWVLDYISYMNMPRPEDSYNFTMYPGSEEWDRLKLQAHYQIPDCVLKKMSTQAVIQAVLEYPLNSFFILSRYGDEEYFETEYSTYFNSCTELLKRKDAGAALLERLRLMHPDGYSYQSKSLWLEWFFGHKIFLSQLKEAQKRQVVAICLRNYAIREDAWHEESDVVPPHKVVTFLLIGRTMLAAKYAPFIKAMNDEEELRFFVNTVKKNEYGQPVGYPYFSRTVSDLDGPIRGVSSCQSIITFAKEYISQK